MLQKDTTKAENKLLQELLMISIKELDSTLKANDNKEKNILRLKKIIKTINGGPNSGNHNPGQGRGVGKPSKKISYEEYVKKFKKSTKTERKELDKKYPEYADKYFDELMGRHLKTLKKEREQKELEEKFKNYENDNSHPHFDLDNMVYEYKDALDITPDEYNGEWNDETKSFEKLKNLKEYYNKVKGIQVKIISMNPADYSHAIIDNDDEHYTSMSAVMDRTSKKGIDMYKEKFNNGERVEIPYIKFDENGKFSGEQEGFHRTLAANEIGDSEVPVAIVTRYYGKQPKLNYGRDITKKVEEYFANKKENNSRINRLVNLENKINNRKSSGNVKLNKTSGNPYHDSKGKFTFSPSGVSKPARGFSSPSVIYTGDDIKLEKDGVILEGTLQYKEGKFYLLIDKEKGSLIEISKDDIRKSIVSKSAKEKQKELLESKGIKHKTPKERRTPEQKHLISELDKIGLLKDKEFGAWCMKYADEKTLDDIYTTLKEAESLGLDISSIQLGKIRSGQTWGRAYYRTDGNFKLALSGQIYDRNPIQEMKIKECREGFHTDNSIKAVVRHETGHIISYQNAQRSFNEKDSPKNIWQQEDAIDSYCGKVVSEAMGYSYFTYRETLKDLKKCSNSEISEYGRTNFKEAIAESWSNPNYSLFTKKVSDILKKDLKKPRENSIMNEITEEIPICSGYGPEFEDFEYETSTGKVKTNSRIMRLCSLEKVINSQKENLDYRYDVKAYKEYLKEWLKHKDEKEYLDGGVLSFAEFWEHDIDYEFEDYNKILKLIDEHNKKKELVTNGGPGSGNHNPGQGRGVGKPANGHISKSATQYSADKYLTRAEHENIINYFSEDNFTDDELDAIASYTKSMRYGASSDLNQAIKADSDGEITETENILYPEDDSQIVTWKDNKEFIEQKIEDKKKYDSLNEEIRLESSILRKGGLSDEKEIENLKSHISKIQKERDDISKTLKYSDYENYIKNYEEGRYDSIKDDQKMWTIDEDKLSKISIVKLRENQKSDSKRFDEVLEIPRLTWSMSPGDKPITTDTLANVYQESFKDLDKLDNIIKNKGFVLDKDITVTRRVANAKVIENQIKNKGEYTQNGITSVTAARSIAKKMPSGVNMGDDLLRITIPAGTKVISTYNPFARDVQKSADKYNGGNLSVEDKRNLRMIKGQNELILPSGSKFVSPNGNSISKNEDGSYQLILKVDKDKTSKNSLKIADYLRNNLSAKSYFRNQRLSAILNKVNRGNPYHDEKGRFSSSHGQGSGIGKSGKENNAAKIYEKYKDRKNPKPKSLSDEERELRVRTIINNAERMGINLDNIKKDDAYKIMKFIGWEGNEIGTVSTEFGLEKISDKEIKDDDYISFNGADSKEGFDALRDGGYRSKIIDENDGPGIYTSQYYDVALEYSKGKGEIPHEERITAIKINNSNIISRDDVNKKLRNSNRNFLRNLPDSAVAALAGYDAMWTGEGDKEILILKPSSAEIIEIDEE